MITDLSESPGIGESIRNGWEGKGNGFRLDNFIPDKMIQADDHVIDSPWKKSAADAGGMFSVLKLAGVNTPAALAGAGLFAGLAKVFGFMDNSTGRAFEVGAIGLNLAKLGLGAMKGMGDMGPWTGLLVGGAVAVAGYMAIKHFAPGLGSKLGLDAHPTEAPT